MVKIVHVKKEFSDKHMKLEFRHKLLSRDQIDTIITEDTDVYNEETGKLLLKFRKNVLRKAELTDFYDAIIHHTERNKTSTRSKASGFTTDNTNKFCEKKVNSNIFGYYDRWGPMNKQKLKWGGFQNQTEVRPSQFLTKYPEQFKRTIPLVESINNKYSELVKDRFDKQNAKAMETPFKISDTAFTTVTTNVNFQTATHKDYGDDNDGFGNLTVIQRGKYKGGETCMPQYGIGVDVREGDILFMDVHQWHGNLPMDFSSNAIRMSIVCYLRKNVWKRTGGWSEDAAKKHLETCKKIESTCKHGVSKETCEECSKIMRGRKYCVHGRRKRNCAECGGEGLCTHGRISYYCKECGGGAYCEHGKRRYKCEECKSKSAASQTKKPFKSSGFKELDDVGIYHFPRYIRFAKDRNRFVVEGHPNMPKRAIPGTGRNTINIVSKYRQALETMIHLGGDDEAIEHANDQLRRLQTKTTETFTEPTTVFEDHTLCLTRNMLPTHVNFKKGDSKHGCKFTYNSKKSKHAQPQSFQASSSSKELSLSDKYMQMLEKLKEKNILTADQYDQYALSA